MKTWLQGSNQQPNASRMFRRPRIMLRKSIVGHYLKYCVFVNEHPSSGTGNQVPVRLNSQGRWEPLYSFSMSAFSETQFAQRRSSPLLSTEPERLFLFCLTLSKKREVFPESRIIYSRDQKASHPENFFLMQLCRCHSIDMSKERELGKITWMSLIIQHD